VKTVYGRSDYGFIIQRGFRIIIQQTRSINAPSGRSGAVLLRGGIERKTGHF
jgi:hypothetical protein